MISVKEFGVAGDSFRDDYEAFQRALSSGERELYVPAGKYRIHGMLTLKSNTTLKLHHEAYIILDDNTGSEKNPYLLTAETDSHDITVDGGVWEGNCDANLRVPGEHPYRGILISFADVTGLTLRNMTVRNSEAFHIRLNYVKDFLVENITFDDSIIRWTQDGVHIGGGCERGVVRHIRAIGASSPNDDMIAVTSDYIGENMGPTDPIWGQRSGPIRDIEIYDVTADNAFALLRIHSSYEMIENVHAHHFSGGCFYIGINMEITPYKRDRYDEFPPEEIYGVGRIRNVTIEDWNIYTRLYYGNEPKDYFRSYVGGMIDIEQSFENLTIRRFVRDMEKDAKGEALPTLMLKNFKKNRVVLNGEEQIVEAGYEPFTLNGNIDSFELTTVK